MAFLSTNDLFNQFGRMQRDLDTLFGTLPIGIRAMAAGSYPPINIGSTPKQVDVYVFAAGMDPQKLDVSLEQNLLTIAGERVSEPPESAQIYRSERFSGQFKRVLTLPEDIDPDKVNASYKDGVLHITIQRKEELQPRKIEVKA